MSEDQSGFSPDDIAGMDVVRGRVKTRLFEEVEKHEHLEKSAVSIERMFVVGSVGAGEGRKGSDIDLLIQVQYDGEATGTHDWLEYMQHDVESVLKGNRTVLAQSLPSYIGYVDPKIGDRWDCESLLREMSQHGDYEEVYDLCEGVVMKAARFG